MYAAIDARIACLEPMGSLIDGIRDGASRDRLGIEITQDNDAGAASPEQAAQRPALFSVHYDDEIGRLHVLGGDRLRYVL
jgi:hypothetical protein